jgi:hypothetical protein
MLHSYAASPSARPSSSTRGDRTRPLCGTSPVSNQPSVGCHGRNLRVCPAERGPPTSSSRPIRHTWCSGMPEVHLYERDGKQYAKSCVIPGGPTSWRRSGTHTIIRYTDRVVRLLPSFSLYHPRLRPRAPRRDGRVRPLPTALDHPGPPRAFIGPVRSLFPWSGACEFFRGWAGR